MGGFSGLLRGKEHVHEKVLVDPSVPQHPIVGAVVPRQIVPL
jgi:hypothetical protein